MWLRRHSGPVSEQDLSDFADGQLPHARARQVAAHLRSNPRDADRVHAYWQQEARLYEAFEVPRDEWASTFMPVDAGGTFRRLSWAAMLAAIMVTSGLLWQVLGDRGSTLSPKEFAANVLEAYAGGGNDSWQSDEAAPSLAGLDLTRTGTRTIRLSGREVIEYRYRDDNGETMALYEMPAGADKAGVFQIFEREDTRLVEWTMANKQYALVAEESASRLTHLAVQIRGNLITRPAGVVESLANEAETKLNIENEVAAPEPQSPANTRASTDQVILPQPVNNNGNNANRELTGGGPD